MKAITMENSRRKRNPTSPPNQHGENPSNQPQQGGNLLYPLTQSGGNPLYPLIQSGGSPQVSSPQVQVHKMNMNQDNQDEQKVLMDSHGGPKMVEVGDKPEALLFDQFQNLDVRMEKKLPDVEVEKVLKMDSDKAENEIDVDGFEKRVMKCLQEKQELLERIRAIMVEARNRKPRQIASTKKYWNLVL